MKLKQFKRVIGTNRVWFQIKTLKNAFEFDGFRVKFLQKLIGFQYIGLSFRNSSMPLFKI